MDALEHGHGRGQEVVWRSGAAFAGREGGSGDPGRRSAAAAYAYHWYPRGRYEVELRGGRAIAISLDGKSWEKKDSDRLVGVFDISDGTFDLWVDDRFATPANIGSSYYDFVQFNPMLPRVDKPQVQGFAERRVREPLDRGLVALRADDGPVYLGWRLLESDPASVAFNVYRAVDGQPPVRVNDQPIEKTTDYVDATVPAGMLWEYHVRTVKNGSETETSPSVRPIVTDKDSPCLTFALDEGQTVQKVGIGDLNGDGRYDYVLKTPSDNIDPAASYWKPSPDTYKLDARSHDGRRLWLNDLGWAIERGIWYSPMIVFDLDGDGVAEVAAKTGEGDPRGADGRVETGPEYVSIFDGRTGRELARDDWPSRQIPGEKYNYNYSSRNQICVAYLDGRTPALIVNRGTYTTIRLVAYQFRDRKLERLWAWDSREEAGRGRYNSQGAHIMKAADIDGDGRDEVIIGSAVVDDNGNGLWATGFGHPDFCFVGDIDPTRSGLEIFYGIEPRRPHSALCLVEARTGKVLWGLEQATNHVGTDGMCADVDPRYPGSECHAVDIDGQRKYSQGWLFSASGELLSTERQSRMSLPVYWDADAQRELIRGSKVEDFGGAAHAVRVQGSVVAIADVVGDWREEIITSSPGILRIYSTTIPATDRHLTLMQDPIYRIDVAVSFMGYYAAPMLSYDMQSQATGQDSQQQDSQTIEEAVRQLISQVDAQRMKKHLVYLAQDPLPYRKLNSTLPGHDKNTLYEADDYLTKQLELRGYQVDREGVRVQAFRCDERKPKQAQYSPPQPEDPWYTAYNLYAERKGKTHPEEIILILAHKDSQSWVDSPGANDNAIGTVGVLELASVLAKYDPDRTIRFLFCNEEHTPWTSVTAAQNAKSRGDNIIAIFNTDGIGAKTDEDTAAGRKMNVTAYTVDEGRPLAELMNTVNARYAIGLEQRSVQRPRPGDDDGSFVKAGYPAAVVNIGSWPYGDPNYHAEGDIPAKCDVENAAMAVQAILAAVVTLDRR